MSDSWIALRRVTPARIALGHAGSAQPTEVHLAFQLAHAQARDAVAHPYDVPVLTEALRHLHTDVRAVHSQASDRTAYLADPRKGAQLSAQSREELAAAANVCDVLFVIADGLSSAAVMQHAPEVLALVLPEMVNAGLAIGPLVVVSEGRVAIGDDVGEVLNARIAVVLIGERPGLSAPDSMGIYLTYAPRPGRTNAERICISNIRPAGLGYDAAGSQVCSAIRNALERGFTGVAVV